MKENASDNRLIIVLSAPFFILSCCKNKRDRELLEIDLGRKYLERGNCVIFLNDEMFNRLFREIYLRGNLNYFFS